MALSAVFHLPFSHLQSRPPGCLAFHVHTTLSTVQQMAYDHLSMPAMSAHPHPFVDSFVKLVGAC
jgi:hypothetical protein